MFKRLIAVALVLLGTGFATAAVAQERTFNYPTIRGGFRLDWCLQWAQNCGQPAANEFCRRRGFARASDFTKQDNVGNTSATRIITSGQICDEAGCDSFSRIVCTSEPETVRYNFPTIRGGFRMDWCLQWAQNCGQPAADEFCRRRGFTGAHQFQKEDNVGATSATRIITSGQICDQAGCDSFRYIDCAR